MQIAIILYLGNNDKEKNLYVSLQQKDKGVQLSYKPIKVWWLCCELGGRYTTWVQETELRSSARTAGTHSHKAISLGPTIPSLAIIF